MAILPVTVAGPASGQLRLIERKPALTSTTATVTFSNLNGNAHRYYVWHHHVVASAAGSSTVTMRPNGLTTNQRTNDLDSAGAVTVSASTTLRVADITVSLGCYMTGTWAVTATGVAGMYRNYVAQASRAQSAATPIQKLYAGVWEEVSTNITSLDFVASTALGFGVGSVFELYYIGG